MTREVQLELVGNMDKKLVDILVSKGQDYANIDVLSNFKRLAAASKALGIDIGTPTGYALFMVLMKIDRISNLIAQDKKPNNESVEDSFGDGINYFKLAYLCFIEKDDI